MSSQVLQLESVSRTYGEGATSVAALRNVNLTVHAGEFVAVMGPSGSGKSSLLSMAGGLDKATGGEIYVEGTPLGGLSINELARLRRRAGPGARPTTPCAWWASRTWPTASWTKCPAANSSVWPSPAPLLASAA